MEMDKISIEIRLKSYSPETVQRYIAQCDIDVKKCKIRQLKYKAHLWFVTNQISFDKLEYFFKKCDKILLKLD
jgi:hypothetical protein